MTPPRSVESTLPAAAVAAGAPPSAEPDRDPPAAPEPAAEAEDAAAWAEVLSAWDDEARHRAYLARFHDLEDLASAGRRYRDVLAERPGDPVAARFRDEVLRRAVAAGLASLPRTEPELPRARLAVRIAAGVVIAGLLLAAALMIARLVPLAGAVH